MLLVTITPNTLPASLWSLWTRGGALVQGRLKDRAIPVAGRWQVAGTEPADAHGPLHTNAGRSP